ncbi:MAG: VapB-type antitoxin [Nitrososphaerota archaeon]|jgi:DNA topoisomerase VI subunit B|nr:VapB-type antitoxin [Nitrososphaerota archaeon]MDG6978297.1 VapB-type antitoxin [Nitrososphaerota archaeon]MDG7005893.1 VapB-type antitoxin [Nitrososphaerota archaeon]
MAATTISVGRKTKEFLARKKKTMEEQQRGQLTWDQFFERLFASATPPQLTKEEAKELKRLVAEARPWKTRA